MRGVQRAPGVTKPSLQVQMVVLGSPRTLAARPDATVQAVVAASTAEKLAMPGAMRGPAGDHVAPAKLRTVTAEAVVASMPTAEMVGVLKMITAEAVVASMPTAEMVG